MTERGWTIEREKRRRRERNVRGKKIGKENEREIDWIGEGQREREKGVRDYVDISCVRKTIKSFEIFSFRKNNSEKSTLVVFFWK